MIALLLVIVVWSPGLRLYECNPGHTPTAAPSNCERVHYVTIARFPAIKLTAF